MIRWAHFRKTNSNPIETHLKWLPSSRLGHWLKTRSVPRDEWLDTGGLWAKTGPATIRSGEKVILFCSKSTIVPFSGRNTLVWLWEELRWIACEVRIKNCYVTGLCLPFLWQWPTLPTQLEIKSSDIFNSCSARKAKKDAEWFLQVATCCCICSPPWECRRLHSDNYAMWTTALMLYFEPNVKLIYII